MAHVQGDRGGGERALQAAILALCEPLLKCLAWLLAGGQQFGPSRPQGIAQLVVVGAVLCGGHDDERRRVRDVAVHDVLGRVAEERRHGIEVALRDRVELVVVAGRAANGQAEEDRAGGVRAVLGVDHLVFLGNDAALVGCGVAAMEAGGDQLVHRRARQQVARDLLERETVEGQVAVEGVDHPVAVGPHLAVVVDVDAMRVGIASGVQPVASAVLPVAFVSEQDVEVALVGARLVVVHEGVHDLRARGQAGDIERGATRQRAPVCFWRRRKSFLFKACQHEAVDRVTLPVGIAHGGQFRALRDLKSPVSGPLGPFFDPCADCVDIGGLERLVRVFRRHPQRGVGVRDALEDQTRRGISRNDGRAVRPVSEQALPAVQPQVRRSRCRIRPVALETLVREQGPHVRLVVDLGVSRQA